MLFVPPPFIKVAAGGPPAGIEPDDIAGLAAWFRADLGVTKDGSDFVSDWADQSGNGRTASESTNKPLWVSSLINGHPALRFDGSNDKLKTADFALSQPYHYFIVANSVSFGTDDTFVCPDNDSSVAKLRQLSPSSVDIRQGATSGPVVTGISTGTFYLFSAVLDGNNSTLAKNDGTPDGSGGNMTSALDGLTFGAAGNNTQFGHVEIAEFALYSAAVTGTDLTNLNAYFNTRYALW